MSKSDWSDRQRSDINYELVQMHRHLLEIEKITGRTPLYIQLLEAINEAHRDIHFEDDKRAA
jgi:hypothetical protein